MNELRTCRDVVEAVTDYLEGGLTRDDRLAFERHVAICPPCRAYLAQMRKVARSAGGLREEALPPELRDRLVDVFRAWRTGS